ncbi:hypothetical protein [Paenibacillus sp. GCM10023250]|uniref:hypothetical protein n=1 Tax=Paenibacillus sp. GCM10023250 TaxID=3252648 RepID=UPI003610F436
MEPVLPSAFRRTRDFCLFIKIASAMGDVMQDAERTSRLARDQPASSQEPTSFVRVIETITQELESIR